MDGLKSSKVDPLAKAMTHAWHDTYRHKSTPGHHLDPRSKLLVALLYVGFVLLTPHLSQPKALAYTGFLCVMGLLCRVSPRFLVTRIGTLGPFIILMGLSAWMSHLSMAYVEQVLGKAFLSIGAMTILSVAVPFPDMLRALQEVHVPRLFILFLAFLYRYASVLGRETLKLERGWKARYFGHGFIGRWRELGHILSALLVRSYERAERVYAAMLSRGFSLHGPSFHVLHFGVGDLGLIGASSIVLGCIHWMRF